jgi:hypothetical protein
MAIKFLSDYSTRSNPPERFTAGQEVEGRSADSEAHFVKRGVAGYLVDGELLDHDHKPIDVVGSNSVEVVTPGTNRAVDVGRAGELLIGQANPRGTTGPGNVLLGEARLSEQEKTSAAGVARAPEPVVEPEAKPQPAARPAPAKK